MTCLVEIENQTHFKIENTQELLEDFLQQLDYKTDTEISVVFCQNDFIKKLNKKYRKKDKATDVLSFPAGLDYFLGDIVISLEKAQEQGSNLTQETEMLLCHGLLHLLGYDHEKSEEDHKKMLLLQNRLLENKKINLRII